MKIRLDFTFEVTRHRDPEPEQHEHRDTETLVEQIGQPHYVGFTPEVPDARQD